MMVVANNGLLVEANRVSIQLGLVVDSLSNTMTDCWRFPIIKGEIGSGRHCY